MSKINRNLFIAENNDFCRNYYKKGKLSPNKKCKAQIYYEHDKECLGTYLEIVDRNMQLIKRIKFLSNGYYPLIKALSEVYWIDDEKVKIYYTPIEKDRQHHNNFKYYWKFDMEGNVNYDIDENFITDENRAHLYFELGKRLFEGKMTLENKEKAKIYIEKSAELNYKHAIKYIENFVKNLQVQFL